MVYLCVRGLMDALRNVSVLLLRCYVHTRERELLRWIDYL